MNIKRIITVLTGLVLASVLTACGSVVPKHADISTDLEDSRSVAAVLDSAKTIKVKKAVVSFGDQWTVTADDVDVAVIKGQFIPILGDTYSMFSNKNNLIGSEAEKIIKFLPGAVIYDEQNEPRGELNQELSLFLQKFTFSDVDGKPIAFAQQNLSLTLKFDITDKSEKTQYKISKALISWGDSLTIERVAGEPSLSGLDAVWFAVIANELNVAESKDDD